MFRHLNESGEFLITERPPMMTRIQPFIQFVQRPQRRSGQPIPLHKPVAEIPDLFQVVITGTYGQMFFIPEIAQTSLDRRLGDIRDPTPSAELHDPSHLGDGFINSPWVIILRSEMGFKLHEMFCDGTFTLILGGIHHSRFFEFHLIEDLREHALRQRLVRGQCNSMHHAFRIPVSSPPFLTGNHQRFARRRIHPTIHSPVKNRHVSHLLNQLPIKMYTPSDASDRSDTMNPRNCRNGKRSHGEFPEFRPRFRGFSELGEE